MMKLIFIFIILLSKNKIIETRYGACTPEWGCLCYKQNDAKIVDCSYNGLKKIPPIPNKTHTLHLEGNEITDVGINSTLGDVNLKYLRVLYLHNNPITEITENAFDQTTHIHTLLLHFTQLSTVPPLVFRNLTHLKWLWLNDARFTHIDPNAFLGLKKLEELYLQNNPWEIYLDARNESKSDLNYLDLSDQKAVKHFNAKNMPKGPKIPKPDCCTLCGLPTMIDIYWGNIPQDDKLLCGCSGSIQCSRNRTCYVGDTCQEFVFSGATSSFSPWGFQLGLFLPPSHARHIGVALFSTVVFIAAGYFL